jgi:MFS family permease
MSKSKIPRKRWYRILPLVFLLYSLAFMDRVNVGFGFAGMEKDLGIGATYAGLAGGIFFIGYLFLQIPSGLWAEKWGAKRVVAIALAVWSVCATLTGFVENLTQLLIVRFVIGFAEGAVLPPIVLLLKKWFPLKERGRANTFWMMSIPFSMVVMSPICGYILTVANWRVMFIIEGILPLLYVLVWWLCIEDSPAQAKWLSTAERTYIEESLAKDQQEMQKQSVSVKAALKNRNVIILVLVWFFTQIGFSGFNMWLPTVLKEFTGGSYLVIGFLAALPWMAAIVAMIIISRHSDKTGERKLHVALPLFFSGVFLLLSALIGKENPTFAIACLVLSGGLGISFNGIWWTIPTTFLTDEVLAVTLGLINAIGNLGGFVGPSIFGYLKSYTNSFLAGMIFLVLSSVLAAGLLLMVRYKKSN